MGFKSHSVTDFTGLPVPNRNFFFFNLPGGCRKTLTFGKWRGTADFQFPALMTVLNIKNMKFPAFYLILGGSLGIVCGGAKGEGGGVNAHLW